MSTASRIDDETVEQVNRHSSRMTQLHVDLMHQRQRSQVSAQDARRRAVQRENDDLEDECNRLRVALAEAHELINLWAEGCELYCRTMHHLRTHWTPKPGTESDLGKILETNQAAIRHDSEWPAKRNAHTERQRARIRQQVSR